jgi:hypothetical protein
VKTEVQWEAIFFSLCLLVQRDSNSHVAIFRQFRVDAVTLYHSFWDVVFDLHEYGFDINLCICDGAEANGSFIKYHFDNFFLQTEKNFPF